MSLTRGKGRILIVINYFDRIVSLVEQSPYFRLSWDNIREDKRKAKKILPSQPGKFSRRCLLSRGD